MQLPNRIGLITLACRDVERMTRLFRDLGWPETPASDESHRAFRCTNGCVVALYPRATTSRSSARPRTASAASRSRSTWSRSRRRKRSTEEAFWGGGFAWRDPEGNVWDVAWTKETRFDDRGGVFFP